jgi:hypothetical protein
VSSMRPICFATIAAFGAGRGPGARYAADRGLYQHGVGRAWVPADLVNIPHRGGPPGDCSGAGGAPFGVPGQIPRQGLGAAASGPARARAQPAK